MKYNWYISLEKRYVEGEDYSFQEDQPKHYEYLTWIDGDKPSMETFEIYAQQDTDTSVLEIVREQRNAKLALTDWRFRSDLTPSQEWINYCQELRDLTNDTNNWSTNDNGDVSINWPTPPG